jgi:AraC family transcriptional activator of tynA and feaB
MYESLPVSVAQRAERFDYFQSVVDRVFCNMQVKPGGGPGKPFEGVVEVADLGSVRLARVATAACTVHRRPEHIARIREPSYLVKFQLKGESHWTQRGREVHLRPGDFVIASTAEPYTLRFQEDYEMPVLAVSVATMRDLVVNPDRFLGVRMMREDADCGLLSSFVAQVVARMAHLREPMISRIEANILDLLGGILSTRNRHGSLSPSQQLVQIKGYIQQHQHDRRLRPAMIAAAFSISTRQLHSLFEAETLTVERYIRRLRVHASRLRLQAAGPGSGQSLTDIAMDCGFYDLSHMSRSFREEFGISPLEFRACRARN